MARPRKPARSGLCFPLAAAAVFFASVLPLPCESACREGCDLALASYYVTAGETLSTIALLFGIDYSEVLPYNNLTNPDVIQAGMRVNIPFSCGCSDDGYLGHAFAYTIQSGDTYSKIAGDKYHNLTTVDALVRGNRFRAESIPTGVPINVRVSCFCGDADISRDYGLFVTYPIRPGDTLETVATAVGFSNLTLLQEYSQGVNFSSGQGIMFVPTKGVACELLSFFSLNFHIASCYIVSSFVDELF